MDIIKLIAKLVQLLIKFAMLLFGCGKNEPPIETAQTAQKAEEFQGKTL